MTPDKGIVPYTVSYWRDSPTALKSDDRYIVVGMEEISPTDSYPSVPGILRNNLAPTKLD